MRILAGDIGGTNVRLSVWEASDDVAHPQPHETVAPEEYLVGEYGSFDEILATFIDRHGSFTDCCIGVAGPVKDRQVTMTNVPRWPTILADSIAGRLNIADTARVNLVNDMFAHGSSLAPIERFHRDDLRAIREGTRSAQGTKLLVMPGTGLGVGGLVFNPQVRTHHPIPSEGGHADFSPRGAEDDALLASMRKLVAAEGSDRVTREMLLSGPGLVRIYACLKNPQAPTCDGIPNGKQIGRSVETDPLAERTMATFTRLLAQSLADYAFILLATGGVYLAGNIVRSIASRIESPAFVETFSSSGPPSLRKLIGSMPISLVTYEETGLLGAANYAIQAAKQR